MNTTGSENVIGVFSDQRSARAAVRFLEHAGFRADDVAVVGDQNVRQARELTGSESPRGAVVGLALGLLLFGAFVYLGGPVMWSSPFVLLLGAAGFASAGTAIGWLAGRARIFTAEEGRAYERAAAAGEVLVSVHVSGRERERARSLLRESGAMTVREEQTVESP